MLNMSDKPNAQNSLTPLRDPLQQLVEYAQHKRECQQGICRHCSYGRDESSHTSQREMGYGACDDYQPRPCTCGLADLLAAPAPQRDRDVQAWYRETEARVKAALGPFYEELCPDLSDAAAGFVAEKAAELLRYYQDAEKRRAAWPSVQQLLMEIRGRQLDELETFIKLDAAPQRDGWQPIETAPKHNIRVLLATADWVAEGHFMSGVWWTTYPALVGSRPHKQDVKKTAQAPTHWMPLPAPPLPVREETP